LVLATLAAACGSGDRALAPKSQPAIDSISPRQGTVGTEVMVAGQYLASGAKVYFGTHLSPSVQLQNGSLFAVAPDSITAGASYDVKVVNADGGTATLTSAFQVVAPTLTRVNSATKPSGLVGMTVLIEGSALGDAKHGKVFFTNAGSTSPIQAVIADSVNDWTNSFIVTTVPSGVTSTSQITVQTATGTSGAITFTLLSGGTFSPSTITWTATSSMPLPLQGLAAAFVPAANASNPANYVYVVGGAADSTDVATATVLRAQVQQTGALGAWSAGAAMTQLPSARAYHALAAATAYNSPIDTTTSNGFLYAIGGIDDAGKTLNSVVYSKIALDGTLGAWQNGPALPVALHSSNAVLFRGYLYLVGGADSANAPSAAAYRAPVAADGSLGAWQTLPSLPKHTDYYTLLNFGPYLYAIGGDTGVVAETQATTSGTEVPNAYLARINLRDGTLGTAGWTAITSLSKGRSKHSTLAAGGYLFATSGVYSGQAGSSENTYSSIQSDGTVSSWLGATGVNTIGSLIGYDLYNQAAVSFVDASGTGHVLVLGGAKRQAPGRASAAVLYY
jgi:hypothetical protein